jgi:DNA-directed DNA polymerase III PolC
MYVSLHNRSAYSFGSALTTPEQLARAAATMGMPAAALTDLDGLYAAVPFQQACHKAGIKPIIGVELKLSDGAGVTLLARDAAGYGNLCRLVSLRHLRNDSPLTIGNLRERASGLICLVGHASRSSVESLRGIFAGYLYVELATHHEDDAPTARARARMADELSVPVVAVCESRCLRRDQAVTLRALSSIGTLTLLDQPHSDKPVGLWHLRSPLEMDRLFQNRPDALVNTLTIAEQCAFGFDLSQSRFPAFASADGRSATAHLRELSIAGCRRRYVEQPPLRGIGGKRPTLAEAIERLDRELSIIEQVHYAEYFLVFHEIVQHCRSEGIATLARGSAADSLVCYALGVSHACPFRFDLPFDRFINPERAKFSKMADIDLDLPWDRRNEVIHWVYERWGHDRVAMIGSANTFRARAAVADLGKVFGLPAHEVHQTTKLLPHVTSQDLPTAIAASPEARDIPVREEPYRTILTMARDLAGLPRHWSMHPCGLVVSPEPLADLVPVQRSPKGMLVAQYEMDPIEELGFVKVDLLGQAGLSVLRDAVAEIERTEGRRVDLESDVDYAEPETWDMIATGNARGVHHIESPAMTNLIQQCNCRDIDCLTAVVAVIRPGAANQGKKDAFARRYQGLEKPGFAHPSLVPVLEKTYGIMVFEEHILQVAVEFAGMNIGRADVLRRALNKQNLAMIVEMKSEFRDCARRNGHTAEEIELVWPMLENFCGFMFNKAHSAEYAVEAFQGAWLKRRWPVHYMAAILSNYRGFYAHSPTMPQILYVLEAIRHGAVFLPPCVNRSRERFSVEYAKQGTGERKPQVRIPVSHVKRETGQFASLAEFAERCRPADSEAQLLLDTGALDVFGESRPAMFWQLRRLVCRVNHEPATLWSDADNGKPTSPPVELTPPNRRSIARREMELLGFPVTIDPLTYLGEDENGKPIDWSRYVPVSELGKQPGRRVTVCGLMVADRIDRTQSGELMKFVTLADPTGVVETIMFPAAYQRFGYLTVANPILEATGVVDAFENGNGLALRVHSVATMRPGVTRVSHSGRQRLGNEAEPGQSCAAVATTAIVACQHGAATANEPRTSVRAGLQL